MALPTIVTIIVLVFLAFFVIKGFAKGFLRILFTTFSIVVTIAISAAFTGPLSEALKDKTFVGPKVEEAITKYIDSKFESKESEAKEKESEFIDSLALPSILKDSIKNNNTLTQYRDLGVKSFKEYIIVKLTDISVGAIAFILLAIVTFLLLRLIFHVLKIIGKIPILRGINRFLGGVLGLAEGLLIIWLICVVIMIFSASDFGIKCMEIIRQSKVLSLIYDHNLLITAANAVFKFL